MKKGILLSLMSLFFVVSMSGQKYFTRDGKISFFSDTPLEKIEAHNSKATSVLDASNGNLEFAVLIKAFQFEKALMQEHFNENYMESSKFPKSSFKGKVTNIKDINLKKDGEYNATVKGQLTIHGVTKDVETTGKFVVAGGKISAKSAFNVAVADYNITIPAVVRDNIAKTVKIAVDIKFEELKQ
ncbi:MAG: YceI family protein [Saprospiraceae bacterium]|nr:YceI family protein [Saprospiraceae bacterium]